MRRSTVPLEEEPFSLSMFLLSPSLVRERRERELREREMRFTPLSVEGYKGREGKVLWRIAIERARAVAK